MPTTPESADSATTSKEPSQMRWQFIDGSNNSRSNLTQVKRHVMQEYMRQKRQDTQRRRDGEDAADESKTSQQKKRRRPKRTGLPKKSTRNQSNEGKEESDDDPKQKSASTASNQHHNVETATGPFSHGVEEIERNFVSEAGELVGEEPLLPIMRHRTMPSPRLSQRSSPFSVLHDTKTAGDLSSTMEFDRLTPWSSGPTSPLRLSLSPKTILSAARTDPFNTLPLEMDLEEQKLFDFYVNEMPACSYGTHFRSRKAHNWYTMVFVPEGMKGAIAFQNTILVHAANTWAWVRNETETKNTLIHRHRAISMLREHLTKNPTDISDVAIVACLSAAGLEDFDPRPGHKEISWIHMRAAREMIRARGGPAAFANTRLGMLINWQDYILSGYETRGLSFHFEHPPHTSLPLLDPNQSLYSMPSPPHSISSFSEITPSFLVGTAVVPGQSYISPKDEIQQHCEEFISFLKRSEHLALHQQNHLNEITGHMRHIAFQEGSLLHQILASPPAARFTASGNRKQFVARLVALMMLNAALWDYRYSVPRSERFLQTLEQSVVDSEVSMSGSVEALLQILLECKNGHFEPTGEMAILSATFPPSPWEHQDFADFSQYSPTVVCGPNAQDCETT